MVFAGWWTNGTIVILDAISIEEAREKLWEFGLPNDARIKRIKDFAAEFRVGDEYPYLRFENFGEEVDDTILRTTFPRLQDLIEETDPTKEEVQALMNDEANRAIKKRKPPKKRESDEKLESRLERATLDSNNSELEQSIATLLLQLHYDAMLMVPLEEHEWQMSRITPYGGLDCFLLLSQAERKLEAGEASEQTTSIARLAIDSFMDSVRYELYGHKDLSLPSIERLHKGGFISDEETIRYESLKLSTITSEAQLDEYRSYLSKIRAKFKEIPERVVYVDGSTRTKSTAGITIQFNTRVSEMKISTKYHSESFECTSEDPLFGDIRRLLLMSSNDSEGTSVWPDIRALMLARLQITS